MKTLLRALSLWAALVALCWLMASESSSDMKQFYAACGLLLLPPLAVWLTARLATAPLKLLLFRITFWSLTIAGWLAVLLLAQGRYEAGHVDQSLIFILSLALAGAAAVWFAARTRSFPTWRGLREAAAGFAVFAIASGVFFLNYEARTKSIATQAKARWTEIGMPMAEFEKTLEPGHENAGSEIVRQILREQVGTRFYKEGTPAAESEPVVERSKETSDLVDRACDILSAKLPPSDDLDLSTQPVAALEPGASAREAAYDRILAAEPAAWASDPHDGFSINVPNFLGIRMFSQLTAADALRRFSTGDQEGAARTIDAGLRVSESLRHNPTLVSLMIHVAIDALLAPKQVRLPATEDGFESIARDVIATRAELLERLQLESWACLRFSDQIAGSEALDFPNTRALPKWFRRIANRSVSYRQCAIAALNGAGHVAIIKVRPPAL